MQSISSRESDGKFSLRPKLRGACRVLLFHCSVAWYASSGCPCCTEMRGKQKKQRNNETTGYKIQRKQQSLRKRLEKRIQGIGQSGKKTIQGIGQSGKKRIQGEETGLLERKALFKYARAHHFGKGEILYVADASKMLQSRGSKCKHKS